MCTGLGVRSPPEIRLRALCLSFPESEEQGTHSAFAAQTCCAFASCSCCCAAGMGGGGGRNGVGGGASSPLPSSRQGIFRICFPGEAQAEQSCCRTPQRIWFPSPHCKNLLLLSNTLLQIRSGLHGFYLVTLRIQPWLMTENAPGFTPTPLNPPLLANPPPPAPSHRQGFLAGSALGLISCSPSMAPGPLAQGWLLPQLPSPRLSSAVLACRRFLGPSSASHQAAEAAAALGAGRLKFPFLHPQNQFTA